VQDFYRKKGTIVTHQSPISHVIVRTTLYTIKVILSITRSTVLIECRRYGNAAIHSCMFSRHCAALWGILGSFFTCVGAQQQLQRPWRRGGFERV
jgi:hypothetical protein